MDTHIRTLPVFRSLIVVAIVSLGLFLLSTLSPWGIFLGFAFVYIAFLVSTALH